LDYENYLVSRNGTCNATEQLEELAKTEGFQGVNDLDEEKTSLPIGEGTHLELMYEDITCSKHARELCISGNEDSFKERFR